MVLKATYGPMDLKEIHWKQTIQDTILLQQLMQVDVKLHQILFM